MLLEISQDKKEKPKTRSEAKGLLDRINSLETCFMSLIWNDILERFNVVNNKLQSSKTELCVVVDLYESLIEFLSFMKYDFVDYEKKATDIIGNNVYRKDIRRQRRRKAFFDEGDAEDVREARTGSEDFKIEFFNEIISALVSQLEKRLKAYKKLDNLFGFLTKVHKIESKDIDKNCKKLLKKYEADISSVFFAFK